MISKGFVRISLPTVVCFTFTGLSSLSVIDQSGMGALPRRPGEKLIKNVLYIILIPVIPGIPGITVS